MNYEDFISETVCRSPGAASAKRRFERIPQKRHPELAQAMENYYEYWKLNREWYTPKHAVYWLGSRANAWEEWIDPDPALYHRCTAICRTDGCRI